MWYFNLRREQIHKLPVFGSKLMSNLFGCWLEKRSSWLNILYKEEICELYRLSSTIRILKMKEIWWIGHIAWMGEKKFMQNFG